MHLNLKKCHKSGAVFMACLLFLAITGLRVVQAQPDTVNCLILLMDFSDAPGNFDVAMINNVLNEPGYTGELDINMVDYWMEVSRGKVFVQNDIVGPYRAEQTAAWYKDRTYREGIISAEQGFDWFAENYPDYAWDALSLLNGRFQCLTVVPSTTVPLSGASHSMSGFTAPNGVQSRRVVGIEVESSSIFGILHEYGHMTWDWPDLYTSRASQGCGYLELMSGGDSSPGVPNAVLLEEHGWMTMKDITGSQNTLQENGSVALRYRNPNNNDEYFIIEARNDQNPTTLTAPLDRGLVIWHVDDDVGSNYDIDASVMSEDHHLYISLEQADGKFDLEYNNNRGDKEDIWVEGDSFNDNTTPNSHWWDGSPSGFGVDNIQFLDGNRISFRVTAPGVPVVVAHAAPQETYLRVQGRHLTYRIAEGAGLVPVEIKLYAMNGKVATQVMCNHKQPGTYTLALDKQKGLTNGIYLCRMKAGSTEKSAKVLVER
jgi:M6 family metalloprotease-like protein